HWRSAPRRCARSVLKSGSRCSSTSGEPVGGADHQSSSGGGWETRMALKMILTGDINLMKVTDPKVPFALIGDELRGADVVFSNLECCLVETPAGHSLGNEGFFADPKVGGEALKLSGVHAVGIANNVHYGEANIKGTIAQLDALGIPHSGA